MRKRNRSAWLRRALPLLLCAVLLLPAGCGDDGQEPARLNTGAAFRVAMTEAPDSLNPFTATARSAEEFFLLAYDRGPSVCATT